MRRLTGLLLPLLLLPGSPGVRAQVAPIDWLLQQVRVGEANHKYELVTQSLYRLDKIDPDNPQVVAAKLRLALRQGDQARAAQLMAQLRRSAPDAQATREAAANMLLITPEGRQQLQQARLLGASGRLVEAQAAWDRLFHGAFPSADMALEYWRLVARLPGQQARALAQMQALDRITPGNAELQQSLRLMQQNVQRVKADSQAAALGARGQALAAANHRAAAIALFRQAIAADPGGDDVNKWRSLLRSNHYWLSIEQGDKALAAGELSAAQSHYQQAAGFDPRDAWARIGFGDVALAGKDRAGAEQYYRQALRLEPQNRTAARRLVTLRLDALTAEAEQLAAQGRWAQAAEKYRLAQREAPDDVWLNYHSARALRESGQRAAGDRLMAAMAARQPQQPAQVYAYGLWLSGNGDDAAALARLNTLPRSRWTGEMRALAQRLERSELLARIDRRVAKQEYATALSDYRQAMQAVGISATAPGDNDTFTRLMRSDAQDDWQQRGIRRDSASLYRQQDTQLTLAEDYSRNKGTGGVSDFSAHTTMMQAETPLSDGRGWLQLDNVDVSAGSFARSANGPIRENFGTCASADALCNRDFRQHQNGTSIGAGFRSERWSADLGTTPLGFEVTNWVGGLSWNSDIDDLGVTLSASRRPIASSLLAFAGARDPNQASGKRWGGVVATGGAVGLSWDRGGAHGVWADLSAHQLTGKNVADNSRERLMSGYYYKLINDDNRRATVGINGMLWHYAQDLSDYSLGQGGYYSPQRYASLSLPVTYRQRTANWSFDLGGSVSLSHAHSDATPRYPLNFGAITADNAPGSDGGGSGFGYTLQALVERRLTSNWTLGLGVDIQQAKDYTPSHGLLFLRYSMAGWQGDLDMPPQPLAPYASLK